MKFRSLRLKDFKGFEDETLNLDRPVTVLVGPNGAGKSSVIDALCLLMRDIYAAVKPLRGPVATLVLPTPGDVRQSATEVLLEAKIVSGGAERTVSQAFSLAEGVMGALSLGNMGRDPTLLTFFSQANDRPLLLCYTPIRRIEKPRDHPSESKDTRSAADWTVAFLDSFGADRGFGSFLRWFREREDLENETKVSRQDLSFEDPQLKAVRTAVASMLPGFGNLRMQRSPLHLAVTKSNGTFFVDQLSDGEKCLLAMAADIASRLSIAHPESDNPLQSEAVVVIDEIELHLHPAWQRKVIEALWRTFPNCQLIVSTHSPQVLSEVPTDAIIMLDNFRVVSPPAPVSGRDSNAILSEVMGAPERPEEVGTALRRISALIDADNLSEARSALESLAVRLTDRDSEIVRLRTMIRFLEDNP